MLFNAEKHFGSLVMIAKLEEQIEEVNALKDQAVIRAEYSEAADFRDQADVLRKQKEALQRELMRSETRLLRNTWNK